MTYEKFVKTVESGENSVSRKETKIFSVKYALTMFLSALAISMIVHNILNSIFSIIFLLLVLFLYVTSFDILAENSELYTKLRKVVRYWWLIVIAMFSLCIFINIFIL